jgi:uncharacterized RDD family membrane protein YckC
VGWGVGVNLLMLANTATRRPPPPAWGAGGPGAGPAPAGAGGGAGSANLGGMPGGAVPYTAGFSADAMAGGAGIGAAAATSADPTAETSATGDAASAAGTAGSPESGQFASAGSSDGGIGGGATTPPPTNGTVDALSLPRAGFWIRILALLIDTVLVGVVFNILDHHTKLQLVALAAYGAIMWKMKGTTVGGIVCNLKIVRVDGREIDWSTAIVRALGCFLSLIVCGLGFVWIAFDPGRQAWHDKIAGTAVVRVPQGVSLL